MLASEKGHVEVVKLLVAAGAKKDVQNKVSILSHTSAYSANN
jgi:hypothetical protein